MDTKTITGQNSLYIDDAKRCNAVEYNVDGVCVQEGTPTPDNPVEVKTIPSIINLFNFTDWTNTGNGLTSIISGTNVKVTGKATSTSKNLSIGETNTFEAGTYTFSLDHSISCRILLRFYGANNTTIRTVDITTGNLSNTVTLDGTEKIYRLILNPANGTTYDIDVNVMLEKGSSRHEYVPYGYWSKVKVTGKNICNGINQNYFINTGATGCGIASGNSGLYVKTNGATSMSISTNTTQTRYRAICMNTIPTSSTAITGYNGVNKDNTSDSFTINTTGYSYLFVNATDLTQIQIEYGEPTTYEPYKENQVLIDMSKENLFDKDNPNVLNAYIDGSKKITTSTTDKTIYISCKPNTTYTIVKSLSTPTSNNKFRVSTYDSTPALGSVGIDYVGYSTGTEVKTITITTSATANYLAVFCYNTSSTSTLDEMLDSLQIFEGASSTPYYELCKIGNYKDVLSINSNGNIIISKNVGKVVLNGSENWSRGSNDDNTYRFYIPKPTNSAGSTINLYSNYFMPSSSYGSTDNSVYIGSSNIVLSRILTNGSYINELNDFKTWLSTHNTEIYYPIPLLTPEIITLKNQPLPLFSGVNHITFVDDFETDTALVYENDISPNDKQALIDGSATIQTEIIVHNDNLYDSSYRNINNKIYGSNCVATEENGEFTLKAAGADMRIWSVQSTTGAEYDESLMGKLYEFEKDTYTMIITNPLFTKNFVTYYDENKVSLSYVAKNGSTFTINKSDKAGAKYFAIRIGYSPATVGDIYKFKVILEEGVTPVLTETNSVIDWNHEDFRQVKDEGFIGQFVARQVTGNLHNLDDDFKITDKELEVKLGVRTNNNTNWYSLGNFLTTKVTDDEVSDKTSFEALDYTKKFNKEYEDRVTYPCTALTLAKDVCDQCGVELATLSFKNDDFVIEGNVFTNNESCRDVMKNIGKLAFSWIRVDWDNKVYIDFNPTPFITDEPTKDYDIIGNNKYYNLKTQKEAYGPVDKVVIGYSAIEGERTYVGEEDGICVINIFDNPLVYNQETRAMVIESARDLLGLTYTPLNTQTIGHPWLRADEPVEITDMENVSHITMPLDRTIQYFGHIKTLIDSTTPTKTDDTLSYKPEMVKNYERSEIYNDQNNKQIGIIIEEQSGTNSRLNDTISTLDGTIQRVSNTETSITDITTTTQHSSGKNHLYLEEASQSNVLEYNVDGATEQQTYSGKNQLGLVDGVYTNSGVTATVKDGVITLTGTNSSTDTKFIGISRNSTLQNSTEYIFSSGATSGMGSSTIQVRYFLGDSSTQTTVGNAENTATTLADGDDFSVMIRIAGSYNTNGKVLYPMIRLSSVTDDTWEPYVGGTPSPNPDYPQEVKTIPSIINMYDENTMPLTKGLWSSGNNIGSNSNGWYVIVPIKGGETYIISKKNSGVLYTTTTATYPANGVAKIDTWGGSNNSKLRTITTSTTANYLFIGLYAGASITDEEKASVMEELQVEKSSLAHEYVPYGYWSKVKVTGKNIFDDDIFNLKYSNSNNELTQITNGVRATFTGTSSQTQRYNTMFIRNSKELLGKTCTFSCNISPSANNTGAVRIYQVTSTYGNVGSSVINLQSNGYNEKTFTFPSSFVEGAIGFGLHLYSNTNGTVAQNDYVDYTNIQLELGETTTTYEPYKEHITLIDMSKENLFDSSNVINGYFTSSNGTIISNSSYRTIYIPCKSDTTYTISKIAGTRFIVGYTTTEPVIGTSVGNRITNNEGTSITITTNSTATYLCANVYGANDTITVDEMLASIKIYESNNPTPYYELCKIGDYKDTLSIDSSGNVVVNKNIGKVVLNGGESWASNSGTGASVKWITFNEYKRVEENICYSNYFTSKVNSGYGQVGLYQICFRYNSNDNVKQLYVGMPTSMTNSEFKTWLSTHNTDVYYVLATPETINLPNKKIPLFEGINHVTFVDDLETDTSIIYYRNTPLSGTYATVTQLNDVSTEKTQEIIQVRNEVQTEITSTQASINVINETIENGVSKVNGTGYTFDSEGLKIEKTNQDVKSLLDNDGLAVSYKGTDLLTVRSNGIEAENMTVRKFYVQRPIRMEKTKSISDGSSIGLGFFYVGEEE